MKRYDMRLMEGRNTFLELHRCLTVCLVKGTMCRSIQCVIPKRIAGHWRGAEAVQTQLLFPVYYDAFKLTVSVSSMATRRRLPVWAALHFQRDPAQRRKAPVAKPSRRSLIGLEVCFMQMQSDVTPTGVGSSLPAVLIQCNELPCFLAVRYSQLHSCYS